MAMPGWQDGMPVLQPPPIPPRRRSPVDGDAAPLLSADRGVPGMGPIPPIPSRRTSVNPEVPASNVVNSFGAKPTLTKTNSLYTQDSALMGFEAYQHPPPPRPYSVQETPSVPSAFMVDLAEIDYTGALQRKHSSSLEDLTPKPAEFTYPDISGAFRELRSTMATPPVYPTQGNHGGLNSAFPTVGGAGGYGWNSTLFDARSSPAFGASSNVGAPTTSGTNCVPGSSQPSLGVFPTNGGFQSMNGASAVAFPAAGNGGAGFYGNGQGAGYPANPFYGAGSGVGPGSGGGQVPVSNQFLSLNAGMPKAASWGNMQELTSAGVQGATPGGGGAFQLEPLPQEAVATEFDENMDLIEFRPGLPEHEYLSLDFFDPLYERGRKESVSVSVQDNKGHNYSFGEAFPSISDDKRPPPELRRHVRRESHEIWDVSTSQNRDSVRSSGASQGAIGFEAVTAEQMFGSSDEDFLQVSHQEAMTRAVAKPKGSQPPRPPPPVIEKKDQVRQKAI